MWMLTAWICNTPTHVVTYTHAHIRRRKVLITNCSTGLWSCPWTGKQRNTSTEAPRQTCAAPREESPLHWSQGSITCTWDALTPGPWVTGRGKSSSCVFPCAQPEFFTAGWWLLAGVESWLFSHTAPSKVWSAPMHISQNIFGMWAVKCCLSPAAVGWAGLWRRMVSLSSGTPS